MNTILVKTVAIPEGMPAVYLTAKGSHLEVPGMTDSESEYARARIDKGDDLIIINRLGTYICVAVNDGSKPLPEQLEKLRNISPGILRVLRELDQPELAFVDLTNDPALISALVEGLILISYRFEKYVTKKDKEESFPERIYIYSANLGEDDAGWLQSVCEAVYLARDLVNEPLSHLNASGLADRFKEAGARSGFTVEVMNKQKIESLRMGGLLAVNRGSVDPPTFSVMEWKPENPVNKKPFVLVGKGVVYDTGGLSLKPTHNSMDYMKCDMAGAATVAGTMYALSSSRIPVHVIGLVPATDNRPDGNAIVPGDIISMYDGTSVEVLNTDAEGRLLLGDALSWAKQYDPALVIDIATLTGSAAAALGTQGMAAMQKDAVDWYSRLEDSGYRTHERTVLFPLWEEYLEMLKSDIADIRNIGGKEAGTITAGKFLEHFTSYPWIHLDIAGTAFLHKAETYRTKGGTGTGVRILTDFFFRYAMER
ncbi:MAG: leucyl aminopeptidase [Marinilabiliales bacterium]|nr:MAG: leucyl aminopeptidase [Marinilabiliales bacterium]